MKKAKLERFETTDEGTFGKLYIDGKFVCYTGELPRDGGDPNKDNETCVDCIPAGTYECNYLVSPKFKCKYYRLQNVPNRSGVLIHTGNYCGNTKKGLQSNVEGCIIVGLGFGELKGQKAVTSSKVAYTNLLNILKGETFELTIVWK